MFAVLEDAIAIYQKITPDHPKGGPQSRAFREVEEWIKSNDLVWPFSFRNLCYALHFDPDYLREGLMRWRTTHKGSAPRTTRSRRIAGMPRTQVAKARPRRTRKAAR